MSFFEIIGQWTVSVLSLVGLLAVGVFVWHGMRRLKERLEFKATKVIAEDAQDL